MFMIVPPSRGTPFSNEKVIVKEAEYRAGWIYLEKSENGITSGLGDFVQFWSMRIWLVSQSDPEWFKYNVEYSDLHFIHPIFCPKGSLQISHRSVTKSPALTTPTLTFEANTTQGLTTNIFWMNSTLLTHNLGDLHFSVPYSEEFIDYSPWRSNQSHGTGITYYIAYTEQWIPLLNFSSGYNSASRRVRFNAIATRTIPNGSLKCGFALIYNQITGLLEDFGFNYAKTWQAGGTTYKNTIRGDVSLQEVNFTEITINRTNTSSSSTAISSQETIFEILLTVTLIAWIGSKKRYRRKK
jgi:hypothetical protein